MRQFRWSGALFGLMAVLILVACSNNNPGTEGDGETSGTDQPFSTNLPVPTSTLTSGGAGSGSNTDPFGLPTDLTGHELIASRAGTSMYSGYRCFIDLATLDVCACDTASADFQRDRVPVDGRCRPE
jgi:hypothetical protein